MLCICAGRPSPSHPGNRGWRTPRSDWAADGSWGSDETSRKHRVHELHPRCQEGGSEKATCPIGPGGSTSPLRTTRLTEGTRDRTVLAGQEGAPAMRTVIVAGHGMVGHRLVEALVGRDVERQWRIVVLAE